jgi:hypothetical protein
MLLMCSLPAEPRQPARPATGVFFDRMYDDFDRCTRDAVLRLYRSVPDVAGRRRGG